MESVKKGSYFWKRYWMLNSASFSRGINFCLNKKSFISRLRNAMIIFLAVIVIFKIVSYIAGRYLEGEQFASFIAYFGFLSLVAGGLFMSVYFPLKYGEKSAGFTVKLPKISLLSAMGKKGASEGEKELKQLLQNERKNSSRLFKENGAISQKLEESRKKCAALESDKRELAKKKSDSSKSSAAARIDIASIFASVLPKKEVVKEEKGAAKEPKIRLNPANKKLSKRFRRLPAQKEQRIEVYRSIARNVQSGGSSFTLSQIMEVLIELFRGDVDADRTRVLREVEEWVNEDASTPVIRAEKGVKHYRIIK